MNPGRDRRFLVLVLAAVLGPAIGITGAIQAAFDVTNTRGDVIAQASTAGALTGTRAYAPYGTVSASTGVFSSALGYQGGWTSGSGLVDMSARWYDPATGAFTSHDPLNAGNPYAYASGDPITHNDPTGRLAGNTGGCGSQCLAGVDFSSVDGVIAGTGMAGTGEAAPVMPAPEVVAPEVVAPELPTVVPGSFGVSSAFQATAMALSQAEGASGASGYGGGPAVHAHPGRYAHPSPTAGAASSPSGSGAGSGTATSGTSTKTHGGVSTGTSATSTGSSRSMRPRRYRPCCNAWDAPAGEQAASATACS